MSEVPAEQRRVLNWWDRNWKWFVPVACMTPIALGVVAVLLAGAAVFQMFRSSEVVEQAVEAASRNEALRLQIGAPIEVGWLITGSLEVTGGSGKADLVVPIEGSGGEADLYLVAEKRAGEWSFSTLVAEIEATGERIDLLSSDGTQPP